MNRFPATRFRPPACRLPLASFIAFFLIVNLGCETPQGDDEADADGTDRAAFVTLLGDDTLAVEQFVQGPERTEATVVLRTPTTTVRRYVLDTMPEGALQRFEETVHDPTAPADAPPLSREVVTVEGDSLRVETTEGDSTTTRRIAGGADALPFLDMVHWPYEVMLTRLYAAGADSTAQPLFTARGAQPFVVHRLAPDAMTITHPFRGTMDVQVNEKGQLVRLDAGATTRKLIVTRVPSVDVDGLAQAFAARDATGQAFGPLSSRGSAEATVDGATLTLDYGVPAKRGREIFGALVPWGEIWRTGANRATHFTTDRTLQMGELTVPPGEYTLYTIPQPDGGTLIINRQTGQGGTTYNEDQDLGRVPLRIGKLPESVEVFTIQIQDTPEGGLLELLWDRTAFAVPFTVQ